MISRARTAIRIQTAIGQPQSPSLRIGIEGWTDAVRADLLISGDVSEKDAALVTKIIQAGFFRWAVATESISDADLCQLRVSIEAAGATMSIVPSLPPVDHQFDKGAIISRGGMADAVRLISRRLALRRTLWREDGHVSLLEVPVGADPWLRRLDLSEVEVMIDAMGVEAANQDGDAALVLSRVAQAVLAALPSLLPPASSVEWANEEHKAGYDSETETIYLIGDLATEQEQPERSRIR